MPYDYIEEYQKQDDETIWEFRDKDAQSKIDISLTETNYANPLSLETMQAQTAKNTKVKLEPIQDLHGYDKPWTGGAGKNKAMVSITSGSGLTEVKDSDNNVIGVKANIGPESYVITVKICSVTIQNGKTYTLSGSPSGFSNDTYRLDVRSGGNIYNNWNEVNNPTITATEDITLDVYLRVGVSYQVNNLIFYPQIEEGNQATAFAPYTNECPITGHTEIDILGCGKNFIDYEKIYDVNNVSHIIEGNKITITGKNNRPTMRYKYDAHNDGIFNKATSAFYVTLSCNLLSVSSNIIRMFFGLRVRRVDGTYRYPSTGNLSVGLKQVTTLIEVGEQIECIDINLNDQATETDNLTLVLENIQLEYGQDVTDYSPYQSSNNLSIDLPSTVYGGVLDLDSGELVVDRIILNASAIITGFTQYNSALNRYISFIYGTNNAIVGDISEVNSASAISNVCDCDLSWEQMTANVAYPNTIGVFHYTEWDYTRIYIYFGDSTVTTQQEAETYLTNKGVELSYKLATPTTIQLTPHQLSLLKAQNNLTTSQYTQIKVVYRNGIFATLEPVSEDNDGLMSRLDKVKLDSIADDATKTESSTTNGNIKINGTETQVYDDSEIKGELTTDTTTIEGNPLNFTTLSAQTAKSTILSLEPIQDLHGYDKPWVGGAGKNLLPMTVDNIKTANTSGTWSGNVYTLNDVTFTLLTDNDNNVIGIKVNGTPSATSTIWITGNFTASYANNMILSGCPSGGSITTYYQYFYDVTSSQARFADTGSGVNVDYSTISNHSVRVVFSVLSGTYINATLYPMIRLSTESDATFQPYTNECGISGRSEIGILGCGDKVNIDILRDGKVWRGVDGDLINSNYYFRTNKFTIEENKNYTITVGTLYDRGTESKGGVLFWDSNDNYLGNQLVMINNNIQTFRTPNNAYYCAIDLGEFNQNSSPTAYQYILLEKGDKSTYGNTDLTISLGQTVYGGTLDVENGVLVVDKGIVDLSDYTWTQLSGNVVSTQSIPNVKYVASSTDMGNGLSEKYQMHTASGMYSAVGCIAIDTNRVSVNMGDSSYQASGQFCYELATPITINLTPNTINLLKGVNNISTDGDKITLTYRDGKVATLGDLLDLEKKLTDEEPYGFIEHMSILDPAQRIEYIGKNKNYKPVTVNLSGDHLANYNDWHDFFVLKENKPYMVKSDGTVDYALDPNDYTKKFDGSASDVADTTYTGGAFAWIPKIYKYEYVEGNDRYVYLSQKKLNDNYEAIGFIDENGLEHDGAWIPMFYGTEITQDGTVKIMTLATGAPTQNRNTDTQKTYLTNANPDTLFFGGAIVKVLTDIMIMLGKNSDVQAVFGTGNMSGGNDAQYMKDNACIDGGAFYGTTTNNVLNKAFHSLVLLTQNQWQRDPYTLNIQGEYIVSPYYKYDLTGDSYVKTGVFVTPPSSNNWVYPNKSVSVPHWGAEPVGPYSGSTTTGWADGQYTLANQLTDTTVRVVQRFGNCGFGRRGGVRCVPLDCAASRTAWAIGASPLLLSKEKTPV